MEYSYADLRPHFGTGRAYTISGTGRNRVMGYRTGVYCKIGDIEVFEWCKLVKALIAKTNEEELFQNLLEYEKAHNYTKEEKTKLEQNALELHAARIFDDPLWINFIPFNQQYRPEILASVKTVTVYPECCKKPGLLTAARYEATRPDSKNFCPHCGRWTTITIKNK